MLYPSVKPISEHTFCSCGAPNFRSVNDPKPIYKLFEVTLPTPPYGEKMFILCENCLEMLRAPEKGE
jgi:hypothetical protein